MVTSARRDSPRIVKNLRVVVMVAQNRASKCRIHRKMNDCTEQREKKSEAMHRKGTFAIGSPVSLVFFLLEHYKTVNDPCPKLVSFFISE